MDPREARAWIAGLEILGMRFGLERMHALLDALGRPEAELAALHVVGTNGKSSTARLAAAALASQGLAAGAYLSPHIEGWTERIQVGGAAISDAGFAEAVSVVREAAEGLDLDEGDAVTQFEALTGAALWAFRRAGVEAAAIEAGLGGRWDATNVLRPGAAVALTNVALEHTDLLGDSEEAIAEEKLAVCPDGGRRLVVGPLSAEARPGVERVLARRRLAPLRYGVGLYARRAGEGVEVVTPLSVYSGLPPVAPGPYQRENLAVALAGAEMVVGRALEAGPLAAALAGIRLPGRLELVPGEPPVVLDGAHNPAGMRAMAGALPELAGERRPRAAVISVLGDKDAAAMVSALAPAVDLIIATRSSHARAAEPHRLARLAAAAGLAAQAIADPLEALAEARLAAGPAGLVLVAGSLYLLGDLRPQVLQAAAESPARLAPARAPLQRDAARRSGD